MVVLFYKKDDSININDFIILYNLCIICVFILSVGVVIYIVVLQIYNVFQVGFGNFIEVGQIIFYLVRIRKFVVGYFKLFFFNGFNIYIL